MTASCGLALVRCPLDRSLALVETRSRLATGCAPARKGMRRVRLRPARGRQGSPTVLALQERLNKDDTFILNPFDYAAAEDAGTILAAVPYPQAPAVASEADKMACEQFGLPWHIVSLLDERWCRISPSGYEAPLVGREWVWGVSDCGRLCVTGTSRRRNRCVIACGRQFRAVSSVTHV